MLNKMEPKNISSKLGKEVIPMSKKIVILSALLVVSLLALPLAGCARELSLTVLAPSDGYTLTTSPVIVRGTVSDAKATVEVNDVAVTVDNKGNFSTTIEPREGQNTVRFVAYSGTKVATKTVIFTYRP